jgi:PAS domain S-box-containing protein
MRAERKLEMSLEEIEELKAALDEHSIVAITDPRGKITYVNDKFCAISKYPRGELLGQDHRIIHSGWHPKEFMRDLWSNIGRGKVWKGVIKNRAKDGSYYWVDSTIVPFLDKEGKPREYVSIRTDVTAHKAAEEHIRQLNAQLEARVAERTAELEAFSYSVSHDLRAPLRAIRGIADMARADFAAQLPEEAAQRLQAICGQAERMGQLMDGLLAVSRLSRQPLNKRTVAPAGLVARALEELRPERANRRVEVSVGELPDCEADPALLQQVFTNLISNALKYSRERDPAVIQIGAVNDNGSRVFFVRDNGAGFDAKQAHRLFGVFQRLHPADQFEGTGIGLAIVQRIVRSHGGRVWAEGETGKGATFYFTLGGSN